MSPARGGVGGLAFFFFYTLLGRKCCSGLTVAQTAF